MGDIVKKRGRLFLAIMVVCMFVNMVPPDVNAEIFDIGEELESEISANFFSTYESGAVIKYNFSNISKILDGNLSTGINETWPGVDAWWCEIYFPDSIFVNNITIKPSFGGNASNYDIKAEFHNNWLVRYDDVSTDRIMYLNCTIDTIEFKIYENGIDQFNFNDILINYDPRLSNWSEIQDQFDDLNQQINDLNNMINNLNNTITALSQTQNKILENITEIKSTIPFEYNDTILNNRILQLESENIVLNNEIQNLTKEIEDLKDDEDEQDDSMVYGSFITGFIGIIIAIVAVILASRKLGEKSQPKGKEEAEEEDNKAREDES